MHQIIIQSATPSWTPPRAVLKHWAKKALASQREVLEVTIRIVDIAEITALNTQYRQKSKPTNVLSFPFDTPNHLIDEEPRTLGDIVICADIVNQEAEQQHKEPLAHWAHMVVHGTLHLLGYDHEIEQDAEIMETLEAQLLQSMGFANPYAHKI